MNVALIGYGVENQAAYRYWSQKGVSVTVCDQNSSLHLPEGVEGQLGDGYLDNLDRFDIIVRTVGMHPKIILEKNPGVEPKITTAVATFFEECRTPIIGVTGTKGKGTTATLIQKILAAAGKNSLLAGNIGTPMLDILNKAEKSDFVVLELSSFQLYDLKASPHVAICLMVVPEHLNWHAEFADYKRAKGNLFRYQNSDDVAIYNAINKASQDIAASSPASTKLTYAVPNNDEEASSLHTVYVKENSIYCRGQIVMNIDEVKLLGRHNLENVCAAITATWDLIEGNIEAIKSVASTFTGLEHRLELVRELNGVRYYNDSFSTTPETAIAAIKAFKESKVLILGGSDKGIPFDEIAEEVMENNVKHVLAVGDTGPTIARLLREKGYDSVTDSGLDGMGKIVAATHHIAASGDVVLLSPSCASFGMFKDYKDRGNQFKQTVLALT